MKKILLLIITSFLITEYSAVNAGSDQKSQSDTMRHNYLNCINFYINKLDDNKIDPKIIAETVSGNCVKELNAYADSIVQTLKPEKRERIHKKFTSRKTTRLVLPLILDNRKRSQ